MNYSVIIPAYNAARTLGRALDSVINQTLIPIEIIIIDDASTDDTAFVINKYLSNPLIKYIHLEVNGGASKARNIGWQAASGEYVAFLDSDDTWYPQKLSIIDKFINHSIDVLWHDFNYGSILPIEEKNIKLVRTKVQNVLFRNKVSTCTMIFKRNLDIRFDESMRYCEDHDIITRATTTYHVYYLPISLTIVHRRINSAGGLSGQLWAMRKGEIYMYSKFATSKPYLIPMLPFLLIWSIAKHHYLLFKNS